MEITYGHSPYKKMFDNRDVYGIGFDELRAAKKPIRLGLTGFGGVALSKHIPAIARLRAIWEPVTLAAVCNRNERSGRRASEIYGANWYADVNDMLNNEQLDGVMICTTDAIHFEHAMLCMERGFPVMIEKPLAVSLSEAKTMVDKAEKAGLLMMTVSNKRYSPPYRKVKAMMENGTLVDPAMFVAKFNLGYDYVDILEGGTIHIFDLMRYFMGDVRQLSAAAVRRYGYNRTGYPFDNGTSLIEFEGGAVGSIYTCSTALSLKPWESVEIYGEKCWVKVDDQYALTLYDDETGPAKLWTPIMPNTLFFDEEFGGFMGLIENFCNSIRGLETPLVTGYDGYKALELVCAFHIAAATGEKVSLPLDPATADEIVAGIKERNGNRNEQRRSDTKGICRRTD